MNKKVYIRQDGTIPGHRIIEELERRGGENYNCLSGGPIAGNFYSINKANEIDFINPQDITLDYTELLYDKNNDTFYEKSQRMTAGEAKEAILLDDNIMKRGWTPILRQQGFDYMFAVPEGYEAKVEDGKVIIRKKKWQPKEGDGIYVVSCRQYENSFIVFDFFYHEKDKVLYTDNIFPTEKEAQAFCDELNNAIKPIIEERRKETEK